MEKQIMGLADIGTKKEVNFSSAEVTDIKDKLLRNFDRAVKVSSSKNGDTLQAVAQAASALIQWEILSPSLNTEQLVNIKDALLKTFEVALRNPHSSNGDQVAAAGETGAALAQLASLVRSRNPE